jgi:predicted NAD-dependent protein-ADP-ribosyltransferase YbiA (DUF1768 family)
MRVILKPDLIVVAGDSTDADDVAAFGARHAEHVFTLIVQGGKGFALRDLGLKADACREPINIHSRLADPELRLIGNLAHTPFELDGRSYQSVEGFWQGLKFIDPDDRARLADLHGSAAKRAGEEAPPHETFEYHGERIRVGRPDHWRLMRQACQAKFTQNEAARRALLSTGDRPLTHRMKRDSETIPGVIMADIWMRIRASLRKPATPK